MAVNWTMMSGNMRSRVNSYTTFTSEEASKFKPITIISNICLSSFRKGGMSRSIMTEDHQASEGQVEVAKFQNCGSKGEAMLTMS